jgi:cold-inducible RNA-binding protein
MRIYVGGLSYSTGDEELREAFRSYGTVASAAVVIDRFTQRSRGFGFVEMPNAQEARAAIQALNGQELGGRRITVNEARPQEDRARAFTRGRRGI